MYGVEIGGKPFEDSADCLIYLLTHLVPLLTHAPPQRKLSGIWRIQFKAALKGSE